MNLLHLTKVEMMRALHRRLVRWMILLALLGCVVCGVIVFASSADPAALAASSGAHPANMRDWWGTSDGDDFLGIAAVFLAIGAAICGASVAGAEWKAGTMTTLLTWQPSRMGVHAARTLSAGGLALTIGFALQIVFLAAALPAVWLHGTTAGTDGGWWLALFWAMVRISFIAALLAVLAANVATIGRNTAAALIALSVWALVLEGLVRGLKPGMARFLIGENVATVVPWTAMEGVEFHRPPGLALATLLTYLAVVVVITAVVFERRDVAGA